MSIHSRRDLGTARAVADLSEGLIMATVEVATASPQVCANTCLGWETSFEQLARFLSSESAPGPEAGA